MNYKEYLDEHTISEEQAKKFNLTGDDYRLNIPVTDSEGKLIYTKERLFEGERKFHIPNGVQTVLFNGQILKKNPKYVIIAGGEMDCIRLDQEGLNAIASSAGESTFKPEWVALVQDIPNIFLSLDNDPAGIKATKALAAKLPQSKVIQFPKGVKDVCEFFRFHTKNDFVRLMQAAKPLEPDTPEVDIKAELMPIWGTQLIDIEFEEQRWMIERFITVGGMTLIVGESGAGKSYVTFAIIKSLLKNEALFGKFEVHQQPKILMIDKENGLRRTKQRMQSMGIPFSDSICFLPHPEKFSLDDQKVLEFYADFIKTNQIKLVVVDSLIDVIIGSENSSVDVSAVFNALRSIAPDCAFVIIHHDSKPVPRFQRTAGQKTRGSSNIIAQVDNQFYLERQKNKRLYIEQGKSRDFEPIKKFEVEFESNGDGEMVGFRYIGEVESEVNKVDEAGSFIESFLTTTPYKSRQEIIDAAEAVGITKTSVERAISMMKDKKVIASKPDENKKSRKLFFITGTLEEMDNSVEEEEIDAPTLDFD